MFSNAHCNMHACNIKAELFKMLETKFSRCTHCSCVVCLNSIVYISACSELCVNQVCFIETELI